MYLAAPCETPAKLLRNGSRMVGKELGRLSDMRCAPKNAMRDVLWIAARFDVPSASLALACRQRRVRYTLHANMPEKGRVAPDETLRWAGGVLGVRFRMAVLENELEVAIELARIECSLYGRWKQVRGVCREVNPNIPRDVLKDVLYLKSGSVLQYHRLRLEAFDAMNVDHFLCVYEEHVLDIVTQKSQFDGMLDVDTVNGSCTEMVD